MCEAFGGQLTGLRGEDAALEPLLAEPRRRALGAADVPAATTRWITRPRCSIVDAQGGSRAVFTPPFSLPALRGDLVTLARQRSTDRPDS